MQQSHGLLAIAKLLVQGAVKAAVTLAPRLSSAKQVRRRRPAELVRPRLVVTKVKYNVSQPYYSVYPLANERSIGDIVDSCVLHSASGRIR